MGPLKTIKAMVKHSKGSITLHYLLGLKSFNEIHVGWFQSLHWQEYIIRMD